MGERRIFVIFIRVPGYKKGGHDSIWGSRETLLTFKSGNPKEEISPKKTDK